MTDHLHPVLAVGLYGILLVLALALAISFVRLIRGPSGPDRVVALDLMTGVSVGIIAAYSALTGERDLLRVAMALALISFLGTVAMAHYLERGVGR